MRTPPTTVAFLLAATATFGGAAWADLVNSVACAVPTRTLSNDCAQRCASNSQSSSCVSLDTGATRTDAACVAVGPLGTCQVADYACRTICFSASQADPTAFQFYIPFGEWQSDAEKQLRKNATTWWQAQIDALPIGSATVPYLGNDFVVTIGALQLSSTFRSINLAGGYSSELGVKGKVANVSLTSDVFANATNVTSVTLAHLNLGHTTPNLVRLLPATLTRLQLVNCLLNLLPSELSQLTSLQTLNLSMNYLSTVSPTVTLPVLTSLDLSQNNLTNFEATSTSLVRLESLDLRGNRLDAIPAGVYALPSLKSLRVSQNPLRLAVLTPDQYSFLSRLPTLEIDGFQNTVDCASGEFKSLGSGIVSVCVTSASELPNTPQSQSTGSSHTVLIVAIVGGVLVLLIVASLAWKKTRGTHQASPTTGDLSVAFAKHDSEGSDENSADLVACSGSIKPTSMRATPSTHSYTTSATHSVGSLPLDGVSSEEHSHSSSNRTNTTSTNNTNRSSSSSSSASGLSHTRTIVIPRTLGRTNVSSSTLWDDGELNAYLLKFEDIQDIRLIGSGGHGVVWLVYYRQTKLLASKRLVRDQLTRQKTFDFVAEIKLVAQLHHPSIVEFVGVAWTVETDLQALFEYMPNGDLRTYLEHTQPDLGEGQDALPQADLHSEGQDPQVLSWVRDKWQIALSISEALVYVHSFLPSLVHRDLKSRNVLLSEEMKAKLSDFGVSRYASENGTMTAAAGTGKWMAPEVIAGSRPTMPSCDIYAFGVLLSELDTHKLPYDNVVGDHGERLPEIALLQRIAANQLKPTFSATCPGAIVALAMCCLNFEPSDRPSAVNVAFELRAFARKHGYCEEV